MEVQNSIVLDLRSEFNKANQRLNKHIHTFKKSDCDVWQDRPNLISFEQVGFSDWRPSVHYLEGWKMILQVSLDVKHED